MKFLLVLVLIAFNSTIVSGNATQLPTVDLNNQRSGPDGVSIYNTLWTKYAENAEYEQSENDKYIRVTASDENAWVFFTKDTHPAHPSYFRMFVVVVDGKAKMESESFTLGDKSSYEELLIEMKGYMSAIEKGLKKN